MSPWLDRAVAVLRQAAAFLSERQQTLVGPVIFGVFCLAAVAIWLPGGGSPAPGGSTGAQDLAQRLAEGRERIAALMPVTAARPLFQADRRPVAAPDAPAPPPEATLILVGILSDGDQRLALMRLSTGAQLYRIEAGGQLDKWQILSIDQDSVLVSSADGGPVSLRLDQ